MDHAAKCRVWRKANAERVAEYSKRYYRENKDKRNRASTLWAQSRRDRIQLISKAQAANQRYGSTGRLGVKDIEAVVERCGRKCHWCGKENLTNRDFTLEHLQPINRLEFLTIACQACNTGHAGENGGRIQTPEERKAKEKALRHAHYVAHKEHNKEVTRQWIANNLERHRKSKREYARMYRAKKRALKEANNNHAD